MSIKVKGFLKDVGGASRVTKMRKALIENASPVPHPEDPIRKLADALHPGKQKFLVTEIEVSTPMTIAHYVGAWKGNIYGFSHALSDHAVARLGMKEEDHFIGGLEFACACGMSGNGMGPAVTNGRAAAKGVLEAMEKKEAAK